MTNPAALLSFRSSLRACTRCPISSNKGGPIPWSGDPNPKYAILGEAPGRTEAFTGEPFVGDSGNILRHWLKQVGIDPNKVAYANSVACWPNRNPATPTAEEMANCRGWAHGQLELIRPEILITMGVVAFSQLRGGIKWPQLKHVYSRPMFHPVYHFTVIPTYHPASYLRGRNKNYEEKITTALQVAADWDGNYPEDCCVCRDPFYTVDEWGLVYCYRHAARQGLLFPEDVGV